VWIEAEWSIRWQILSENIRKEWVEQEWKR
jgi:hypothetical protein